MKKEYTEIVCIIDRSGSMRTIREDAIGGFNTFLEEQKKLPGEANLTFIQFDNEYKVVYENMPLKNVPMLNANSYVPRGSTALLDAIGTTIDRVGTRLNSTPEENRPSKVIMAILTDGEENASTSYSLEQVKEMITHQEDKYAWEILYLGANQDAFAEAAKIGIKFDKSFNFQATGQGLRDAYSNMNLSVGSYRTK